jgi:anaerobic ribonucleoside-triphosphate reductase activating protein
MRYLDITAPDISNGTGCRVTLWISGCLHKCPGCHNPSTWSYDNGKIVDEECYQQIAYWLSKPFIKGLTLSGGDPLANSSIVMEDLKKFVKRIKEEFPEKDIWVYTGYVFEELRQDQKDVLKFCDVLVDGPYKEELRDLTLPFRGSSNQRIIDLHQMNL